jgi:hypothetical protein
MLTIGRISLGTAAQVFPLRREWLTKESSVINQTSAADQPWSARWRRVAEVGPVAIFENARVLPRVWLVTDERVASGEQQLKIIRSGKIDDTTRWDPIEQVLLERRSGVQFPGDKTLRGRADIERREPNRVEVKTESVAPSLLVLADNYYPGWRAKVDGRSARILRVNYNQRGVALPAGRHVVTFVYQPDSVQIGLLISLATLLSLLWWAQGGRETSHE